MTDFDAVFSLIQLLADPAAAKARMAELVAAMGRAEDDIKVAGQSFAAVKAEEARLAKLAVDLREREVKVGIAESKIEGDLAELQKWKRESRESRLITVGPGGLTKEPDNTPNAPDPISDRFAEPMGKPSAANVRRTSQRARA
jgi:hypothetical protein